MDPITVGEGDLTVDTDRSTTTKTIVVVIRCFSKTSVDIDNLADGVSNTIRTNVIAGVFRTGLEEENDLVFPNDGKVKAKTITVTYMRR